MDVADLLEWPGRADVPGMLFRRLIARHSLVGIDAMTRAEQVLWLTFELLGEVSNGGLQQFFDNSSGDRAPMVPAALRELGRPALADALETLARGFPTDRVARHQALQVLTPEGARAMQTLEQQLHEQTDALLLELTGWVVARAKDFTLPNCGLAAFRPVDVPLDLPLADVFADGVEPDMALPTLFVRWAGRSDLSREEKLLSTALYAFGEVSDEGPVSYFFCRRGDEARAAVAGLEAMGAHEAAKLLEEAISLAKFTPSLLERRTRMASLDSDERAALGKLQWEMDDLREPTLDAMFAWAKANRAAFK